jgi:hypothetical protein
LFSAVPAVRQVVVNALDTLQEGGVLFFVFCIESLSDLTQCDEIGVVCGGEKWVFRHDIRG